MKPIRAITALLLAGLFVAGPLIAGSFVDRPIMYAMFVVCAPALPLAARLWLGERPYRCGYDRLHFSYFSMPLALVWPLALAWIIFRVWRGGEGSFLLGDVYAWDYFNSLFMIAVCAGCFAGGLTLRGAQLLENAGPGFLGTDGPSMRLLRCHQTELGRFCSFFCGFVWAWSVGLTAIYFYHKKYDIAPILIVAATARAMVPFVIVTVAALMRIAVWPAVLAAAAIYAAALTPVLSPAKTAVYFAGFLVLAVAAFVELRLYRKRKKWGTVV